MNTFRSRLAEFFPPPAFLYTPAAGLDLADEKVRFVKLKHARGSLALSSFGEEEIPKGLLERGTVKEPEKLRDVLKKFARTHHLKDVRVSLPEEKVYLVTMRLPKVSGQELKNAVLSSLEEYVPLKPEEATFDAIPLPPRAGLEENEQDVLVGVMRTEDTLLYWSIFEGTGMTPVAFEIEAQAIARASIPKGDQKTRMIIDYGRVRTGVSLARGENVQAASTLEVGSQALTEAIVKHLKVSFEEAEKMKNERSITVSKKNRDFSNAILPMLSVLQDEIRELFVYWSTKATREGIVAGKIEEILLTGGGANLLGFAEYLADGLRIPTRIANPWENIASFDQYVPPIQKNEALGYSAALGLALGDLSYD